MFLERLEYTPGKDPAAREFAMLLTSKAHDIGKLVTWTDRFARILQEQFPEYIVCHADIHGWNLLIDENNAVYIVDWDTLIWAPEERDSIFMGAGPGESGYTPNEEETIF